MVGSVGSNLVQFRFNVGEVSVHVEDDVWFSCGTVWFNVGYAGSIWVQVWFSFGSVLALVDQCWFWFGSVWFRLVQCWSSFGSVLVQC